MKIEDYPLKTHAVGQRIHNSPTKFAMEKLGTFTEEIFTQQTKRSSKSNSSAKTNKYKYFGMFQKWNFQQLLFNDKKLMPEYKKKKK